MFPAFPEPTESATTRSAGSVAPIPSARECARTALALDLRRQIQIKPGRQRRFFFRYKTVHQRAFEPPPLRPALIGGLAVDPPPGLASLWFFRNVIARLSLVQVHRTPADMKAGLARSHRDCLHQRALRIAVGTVDRSTQLKKARH